MMPLTHARNRVDEGTREVHDIDVIRSERALVIRQDQEVCSSTSISPSDI